MVPRHDSECKAVTKTTGLTASQTAARVDAIAITFEESWQVHEKDELRPKLPTLWGAPDFVNI